MSEGVMRRNVDLGHGHWPHITISLNYLQNGAF